MSLLPVLYAEDEEDDAFFMNRAFQQAGVAHPLVVVHDGQEALDYCLGQGRFADRNAHPLPCLLLLDLNLPKKSGLEILKFIRNVPALTTLPVLVITSSVHDADVHRAFLQGANSYVVKPSQPDALVPIVKSIKDFWLTYNRTDRRAQAGPPEPKG